MGGRRLFVLLVALAGMIAACGGGPKDYDIVLITIDTIRADHLGVYGYFRDTSPAFDAFARESLLFERCIVPIATTLPSHLSLLTGVYPAEHGVIANAQESSIRFMPSENLRSIAQAAVEIGYRTAAFVSATPLKRHSGIQAGFDVYSEPEESQRRAEETNADVFAWLDHMTDDPYFLWVHYFDPHTPYDPPAPYDEWFQTDDWTKLYTEKREFAESVTAGGVTSFDILPMMNWYDGEIRYLDEHLSRLLERLRASGRWDRTVVVIVGDHGEGLGQHGQLNHGRVWHEQIHVPFLIHGPGVEPGRVKETVSSVDVLPTIRSFLPGVAEENFWNQVSGRDVLSERFEEDYVVSQSSARRRNEGDPFVIYSITGKTWKFVYRVSGSDELYHLPSDPFELNDLSADHPDTAAALEAEIRRRLSAQTEKALLTWGKRPPKLEQMDPKIREELEALGYIE